MNLRQIVYASAVSTFLNVSSGCAILPDLKNPEVRMQLVGTYKGVIDGNKVTYKVKKEGCVALVDFGPQFTIIVDKDCDNTADLLNLTMDRKYLLETGKAENVDLVLKTIQKELVNPEHKVK